MFEVFYNFCLLNQEIFLFLNKITNIGFIPYFLKIISFCFNIANFALIYILYCIYLYIQLKKIKNDNERQNKFWGNYNKLVEIGIIYAVFGLVFTTLKFSVSLPRPYCSLPIDSFMTIINTANERCFSSFPSSHAALSILVTYLAWDYIKLRLKILMICVIILVSLSRISLAMHYPSDITYGIAIAFITILIGKLIYRIFANNVIKKVGHYFCTALDVIPVQLEIQKK
ncbi:phosphatase PAP2 family protein [Rickettsia oklahomensis]|uniref:Phosphatase PAP2 family protein n=1 Tax=Rickettsia oklahomensis TaxID=3141789 RepID=A0AAU7BYS6_9RICK